MSPADEHPRNEFRVVVNHEDQYSLWPAERELPAGWEEAGVSGTRDECLAHVERVWTDMRPRSVRPRGERHAPVGAASPVEAPDGSVVERLGAGEHPVELVLVDADHADRNGLRRELERGRVRLRFPGTRGGTEVGVELEDPDALAMALAGLDEADRKATSLQLAGSASVDDVEVRCVATIQVDTLSGTGRLIAREDAPPGPR